MAVVLNHKLLNERPEREMGEKSASNTARFITYFDMGTFQLASGTTTAQLPTNLTSVDLAIFTPRNAAARTAGIIRVDAALNSSGQAELTFTNPGGTAEFSYRLIGTDTVGI